MVFSAAELNQIQAYMSQPRTINKRRPPAEVAIHVDDHVRVFTTAPRLPSTLVDKQEEEPADAGANADAATADAGSCTTSS